ncbi:MAG: coiled-coil domain-containing protein, partial [Planctomycetota bacterium]
MPREFQDLTDAVSDGSNRVAKGLAEVRDAADAADIASGKLSSTQKTGTRIASGYTKTMAGLSKELKGISMVGEKVSRGLTNADSSIRSVGSSLSDIRTGASDAVAGLEDLDKVGMSVADTMDDLDGKEVKPEINTDSMKKARDDAEKTVKFFDTLDINWTLDDVADEVSRLKKELVLLQGAAEPLDALQREDFLNFSVRLAGLSEFENFIGQLPEAEQKTIGFTRATEGLDAAINELADSNEEFAAKLRIAQALAKETAKSAKTYGEEVAKASKLQENLNDKLNEGASEAEKFAGGIGVGNGPVIAAGVAVAYLATKVAELIAEYKDAAIGLADFNIQLANLEARAQGLGFTGSFAELRDELNLTREQSLAFFEVLEDGVQSGVISVDELRDSALKLQAAFGGDQTERLKEYVELLKDIPTLDTDLSLTASLDDQAASVFELAKQGKISTVIDLQTAGLAGGIQVDALSPEDAELLNAAQKTDKSIEDIQDTLLSFFPSWGPMFSAGVGGIAKVAAGIGSVVAGIGFLNALTGKQIAAQVGTTGAVLATGGAKAGGKAIGQAAGKASGGIIARALAAIGIGGGSAAAGGGGGLVAGAGALASNPVGWAVAIGLAVVAIGAGLAWAGDKASDFGDELIADGKKLSGGLAKLQGATMKAQASLLLLGPLAGTVAAVYFAMDDIIEGLDALGDGLQEQVGPYNKYGDLLVKSGQALKILSRGLDEGWKSTKEFVKGVAKGALEFAKKTSPAFEAVAQGIKNIFVGKELQAEQKRLAGTVKGIDNKAAELETV